MPVKRTVLFRFDVDDHVKTSLNNEGIVRTLAFDLSGVKYQVSMECGSQWYPDAELKAVTTDS